MPCLAVWWKALLGNCQNAVNGDGRVSRSLWWQVPHSRAAQEGFLERRIPESQQHESLKGTKVFQVRRESDGSKIQDGNVSVLAEQKD